MTCSEIYALLLAVGASARFAAGLDLGVSHDSSALTILARLPISSLNPERGARPIFLMIMYAWPKGTPLHDVLSDVLRLQPALAYLTIEVNGVGAAIGQEAARQLRSVTPRTVLTLCATTAPKKTLGYTLLLSLFQRGQLLLLRNAEAIRQFAGMQFEQGMRGAMHIENDPTQVRHDDLCDSAYLACCPVTTKNGLRTRLSIWADPEKAVPDASVPIAGGEIVTTGNGLRVWRHPPLQSVTGPELTYPSGWQAHKEPAPRVGGFVIRQGGST